MSGTGHTTWYARFSWGFFLLGVANIAVGTQLDFATRTRPALAEYVPEPFRAHAYVPLARSALEGKRGEAGMQLAQSLLLERPLPAESVSLVAIAAQMLDDNDLASRALTASASRGWRDPVAQTAVVYAALDAEDWQVLAERIDALHRTGNQTLVPSHIMNELLATDEGQRAVAARLSEDRSWLVRFLDMGRTNKIAPVAFGDTMRIVHSLNGPTDCIQLAVVARNLLSRGEALVADNVWGGHCEAATNEVTAGFRPPSVDIPAGPFEWIYPSAPGLRRSFQINAGNEVLNYQHNDRLRAVLAERFLRLPAGTHTIRLSPDTTLVGSRIFFRLECTGAGPAVTKTRELEGNQEFVVQTNCPIQRLVLSVTKGRGENLGVLID